MKAMLKNLLLGGMFILAIASPLTAVGLPQNAAAKSAADCEKRILGIPPWYRGLIDSGSDDCSLVNPNEIGGIGTFVWRIVLNAIEMAIVLTTYLTAFFIIYGGFLFMTGGNNPGQVEKARKTILNAVIGLVICMAAIALTNLVFRIVT